MTLTYYVARTRDGLDTFPQMRKLGTSKYGYRTLGIALRYTPPGGYVEERHTDGIADWSGRIVAEKPESETLQTHLGGFWVCLWGNPARNN